MDKGNNVTEREKASVESKMSEAQNGWGARG